MSWRILITALLLGLAAAAWGGIQLGYWLIEHGPLKTEVVDAYQDLYTMPTLGADGRPYVPSPPQPLVDGSLAVPQAPENSEWEIVPANLIAERPPIALGTASGGSNAGSIERSHVSRSGLRGIAQIGGSNNQAITTTTPNENVLQPIDLGNTPPPPSQEVVVSGLPVISNPNWQIDFQRELKACDSLSFTRTPSCKWDARNKYCGPNNAWGRVPGCPAKAF